MLNMDNEKKCRNYKGEVAKSGISFGCALAMVISFTTKKISTLGYHSRYLRLVIRVVLCDIC